MTYIDPKNRLRKALSPSNSLEAMLKTDASALDAAAPSPLRPRRPRSLAVRASAFGFLAIVVALIGWFLELWGVATRIEFSPDTFRHRSSWYVACLFVPISPPIRKETEFPLDRYLRDKGYVTSKRDIRWDFVDGRAPGVRGMLGSAKYYCRIGCSGEGAQARIQWSEEHPDLADVVWPQVVKWAREDKYEAVYYLFNHPRFEKAKSVEEFRGLIANVEDFVSEEGPRDNLR